MTGMDAVPNHVGGIQLTDSQASTIGGTAPAPAT